MDRKRAELENELLRAKLWFTRMWVSKMLASTNEEWSSKQKRFIDALYAGNAKSGPRQ